MSFAVWLPAFHYFSDNEGIRCVTRMITAKLVMYFVYEI